MSDKLELVAKAIHQAVEPWDRFEIDRTEWLNVARAAIEAMREPTDKMRLAAIAEIEGAAGEEIYAVRAMFNLGWRGAVSSILNDHQ